MKLNADFNKRVVIHNAQNPWVASPMAGVDRKMLDRIGDEIARATSIVRYAKGSHFSPHVHDGGEEFIVLDGVFQDEHGDYPAGSYIRNPPTSSHTPGSAQGCTIFVKLHQFHPDDRTQVKIDMNKMHSVKSSDRKGASIMPLFCDTRETVQMELWEADSEHHIDLPQGGEFLVLQGGFTESGETLMQHDWLRMPMGTKLSAKAGPNGAHIWMKRNHIPHAKAPLTL